MHNTDPSDERSPTQRRAGDLTRHARDAPRFGGRIGGDWEPELRPDEHLQLNRIAERLTMLGGASPGRLFLTDQRLIFEPMTQAIGFPVSLRRPRHGLRATRSWVPSQSSARLYRQGHPPVYLHTADIKVSRGRKAASFRVYDAEEWERALENP